MLNKLKSFFATKEQRKHVLSILACIAATAVCSASFALAAAPTADGLIGAILNVIFTIAGYIGVLLLVWGIVILVLAIRNEDADSKSRAVLFIVVAIVLICLGSVFKPVMDLLGVTIG